MTFYSDFSDNRGKVYKIEITNSSQGNDKNIIMGGEPCIISTSSNGMFAPIKSRSCSLEFVTDTWYFQLYEPTSRGTRVKVYEYDATYPLGVKKVIFRGYLTPCSYDQTFTYLDTITLEAVDAISTTKDFRWVDNGVYNSIYDIIINILNSCGYQGKLYVPRSYSHINNSSINGDVLDKLMVSSGNFIDDDDEKTRWKLYDVLTEILKFLNWSLVTDGDDVWLMDYRAEGKNLSTIIYSVYDIQTKEFTDTFASSTTTINLTLDKFTGGTTNLSMDDCYNKIEISDNLYKINEVSPDIFDDGNHISITEEKELGEGESKWSKVKVTDFLWWNHTETSQSTDATNPTGYDYQTFCRLNPASGWTHHYYRHSSLEEVDNSDGMGYYDPYTASDPSWSYKRSKINQYLNTHGCLIQHYAHVGNLELKELPTSVDWTDVLTFFVLGPTSYPRYLSQATAWELPVLEYNINEEVQWKPSSGTSWLYLKGDLFYQTGGTYDAKKKRNTLSIINVDKNYYTTNPIDKSVENLSSDRKYCSMNRSRKDNPDSFGHGFGLWKIKLQIGDKYWAERYNSSTGKYDGYWTTDSNSTVYIRYNNDPTISDKPKKDEEYIAEYKWMNMVNNTDYKDKAGVDGYCFKIASDDPDAPTKGKLKLTIYTPSLFPYDYILLQTAFSSIYPWLNTQIGWGSDLAPIIYCKGFEFGYIYSDSQVWYNNHENNTKNDKVYTGRINDNYVQSFDRIELKVNTANQDQPISKSYVITSSGDYLQTMRHVTSSEDKVQEFNIVDAYLDHNSDPKPILEANIKEMVLPTTKYVKEQIEGLFVVDSQSFNVRERNNRIKIISF